MVDIIKDVMKGKILSDLQITKEAQPVTKKLTKVVINLAIPLLKEVEKNSKKQ